MGDFLEVISRELFRVLNFSGESSKTNFEPIAKRFDPILDKVLSELKNYLSSISLSKLEDFHTDVSISS